MNKKVFALCFSVFLLFATGCSPQNTTESTPGSNPASPVEVPQTIASLSPTYTQIIIDLGAGDRLVVVDNYSATQFAQYLPAEIVVLDMMEPDVEILVSLAPDYLIISEISTHPDASRFDPLVGLAGTTLDFKSSAESIADIKADILSIAAMLGAQQEGAVLVSEMEEILAWVTAVVEPIQTKTTVFYEQQPLPSIYSFGTGVFQDEVLTTAGGINVFAEETGWFAVTEEAAIGKNPQAIFTAAAGLDDPVGEILGRKGWGSVDAVKNQRVFYIEPNLGSQANHRIALAIAKMGQYLYPQEFASAGVPPTFTKSVG